MRIHWRIGKRDVEAAQRLLAEHSASPLVARRQLNLSGDKPPVRKERFWLCLMVSLITSQQRSGPRSRVQQLIRQKAFPLTYRRCARQSQLRAYARAQLAMAGLRFADRLAESISSNFEALDLALWRNTQAVLDGLQRLQPREVETAAAEFLADRFKGLGPKQSRNLLQMLHLTRYEIPLDSRVTKWLQGLGFPFGVKALSDPRLYAFVLDLIEDLCARAGTYPCVLDAAIFVSFDPEGWITEDFLDSPGRQQS